MSVAARAYNKLLRKMFYFNEKYLKTHIMPVHYYSPVPDSSEIIAEDFSKKYSCKGIDWRDDKQVGNLENIFEKYKAEYTPSENGGLSIMDAYVLYAFVRENKPRVMIEIGAGDTTLISLKALKKNREEGFDFTFHSIEPFPRNEILDKAEDKDFHLHVEKVQDVPVHFFSDCDFLFIDSSHVCKIGSDVNYELLEIVPSLKVGALIHWHDIFFPAEYWKEWVQGAMYFWNESYFLQSFMSFNDSFKIEWASRYMQLTYEDKLKRTFPYYIPEHRVSSFWARRVK
ncbi:class I SAM-dependent methyltransferase [Halobacteriovorax sp. HLS]|uniref:class I SAM-dependent methyltransferase n=1 Tax=Halobacteriovorax sp. HLS TaxID=2234000 RepID=UPI000FD8B7F7|nr:class I SAM-dependent methyltransferase [Halobacteriovorax sp. HLS]